MSLLKLCAVPSAHIKIKNDFLAALHRKRLFGEWLIEAGSPLADGAKAQVAFNFIWNETHELALTCAEIPFLTQIEAWVKPWHWHELTPALAHGLLDEILSEAKRELPQGLKFNHFSTNPILENNFAAAQPFTLSAPTAVYHLTLHTQANFPFADFAASLPLTGGGTGADYPPALLINLPLQLGSTILPLTQAEKLHAGDIILVQTNTP